MNTTGAELIAQITVAGVAVLAGSVPLPTAAKHDTLAALVAAAVVLVAGLVAPPDATFAWTRNGAPVGSDLDLFGDSVPRLTLRSLQPADAGTDVCTASNVFGSAAIAGLK